MTAFEKKTKWWIGAVVSPFLFLAIGILIALATSGRQDDWLGMRFIVPIMGGLVLGCLLSFVFTAVSIKKREEGYFYALLVSVPSLVFILYQISGIVTHR